MSFSVILASVGKAEGDVMARSCEEWMKIVESIEALLKRYTVLSKVMSLATETSVRMRAAHLLLRVCGLGARLVDVGCGKGDSTRVLIQTLKPSYVVALDPSEASLNVLKRLLSGVIVEVVTGVGEFLPLRDESFEACTTSFALRDFIDYTKGVEEMLRVSRKAVVVLDLFKPKRRVVRMLSMLWFCKVVPLIALALGLPFRATRKLCETLKSWLSIDEIARAIACRDRVVTTIELHLGTVGIILVRSKSVQRSKQRSSRLYRG